MAKLTLYKKLAAKVGEYREGNTVKGRYFPVGAMFTDEKGEFVIKLEGVPVGPDFKEWVYAFDPKDKKGEANPADPSEAIPFE